MELLPLLPLIYLRHHLLLMQILLPLPLTRYHRHRRRILKQLLQTKSEFIRLS
jgi:hypothetical protein